jgi:hypothetical protein
MNLGSRFGTGWVPSRVFAPLLSRTFQSVGGGAKRAVYKTALAPTPLRLTTYGLWLEVYSGH